MYVPIFQANKLIKDDKKEMSSSDEQEEDKDLESSDENDIVFSDHSDHSESDSGSEYIPGSPLKRKRISKSVQFISENA